MHPGFIYVVNGKSWSEEIQATSQTRGARLLVTASEERRIATVLLHRVFEEVKCLFVECVVCLKVTFNHTGNANANFPSNLGYCQQEFSKTYLSVSLRNNLLSTTAHCQPREIWQ